MSDMSWGRGEMESVMYFMLPGPFNIMDEPLEQYMYYHHCLAKKEKQRLKQVQEVSMLQRKDVKPWVFSFHYSEWLPAHLPVQVLPGILIAFCVCGGANEIWENNRYQENEKQTEWRNIS